MTLLLELRCFIIGIFFYLEMISIFTPFNTSILHTKIKSKTAQSFKNNIVFSRQHIPYVY